MKAAVVTAFDQPPRYRDFPDPAAAGPTEMLVEVVAAGLHPLVRSRAVGSHYSSTGELPLVPGVDAVVRDSSGALYYSLVHDSALGTMAQRTVVDIDRSVPLPEDVDPVAVAAGINPAMASWMALRHRIDFTPGSRVLVLGATGSAGRVAIQVAKRFGAAEVVAAGRDSPRLAQLSSLGADRVLRLDQLAQAADVDVVIDYLWGAPAALGMGEMVAARRDRSSELTWIQIGSMAGLSAEVLAAALRSTRLHIVGSGFGSVSDRDFRRELPEIARAVSAGDFDVRTRAVPLDEVSAAWQPTPGDDRRVVFLP